MAQWALDYDGSDDYVAANSVASGGFFGGAFTIRAWAKLDTWANNRAIVACQQTGEAAVYINMGFEGASKKFVAQLSIVGSENKVLSINTYDNDSGWHFFALMVNSSGHITNFYIDNVSQGSDNTFSLDLSAIDKLYIGQLPYTSPNINPWDGIIDEVEVSNIERTSNEVAAIWNNGNGVQFEVDGNTEALWHKNEGANSTIFDETANNNDGTINGASWVAGYDFIRAKTSSDTASGVDAVVAQVATLVKSDTGSGVEASVFTFKDLFGSDTGGGTEALVAKGMMVADTGSGIDALVALIGAMTASDTGSGVDAAISGRVGSDTGVGVDTIVGLKKVGRLLKAFIGRDLKDDNDEFRKLK